MTQQTQSLPKVNVDNFARIETANQFDRYIKLAGEMNAWYHIQQPTRAGDDKTIRMNQDTLYSTAVVDISQDATLTMPETSGSYQSLMVVNQDGYINHVYDRPGTYPLTLKEFETPFVMLAARTLVKSADPADVTQANALQDGLKIDSPSSQQFPYPPYDQDSYQNTFDLLVELSRGLEGHEGMAGSKEEVDPVHFLLANAFAWGGLPEKYAYYENIEPQLPPTGAYHIKNIKDVPVDHFWSITVYNKEGFLEPNRLNRQSYNNLTAQPNPDGSITIRFGGDPSLPNMIPVTEGWNYMVRYYGPQQAILSGSYRLPKLEEV